MEKHINYVNSIANELMEAEIIVKSIKHSKEWKNAINYFNNCCNRGYIKERPMERNDYQIIVNPSHCLNSKYMDYFTKAVPILLKAEKIVHEIKRSKQWKETQCYCNTLVRRGKIKACPSFKNGYTIEKLPQTNNSSKSWKKLFEEQKRMSMAAKDASQKKVFSFRAAIGNISIWKAYATACGKTMEEIGNDAMDFYMERHKLTEAERTVFNALLAKNSSK